MDEKQFHDYLASFADADKIMSAEARSTIRVNTLKISKKEFFEVSRLALEPTFYDLGFYSAEDDGRLGATWEYFLGHMHTQTLSSMLPSLVLNPGQGDIILDAAAAPGSKTTHLAMLMQNKGAILANEVNWDRASILFSNIARLGVLNAKVGVRDGTKLGINSYFTKALVDAPCSSLSQPFAFKKFTPNLSYELSKTQRKMIFSAYDALQDGGELVYSTCTYEKEENEGAIALLLEKRPEARLIDIGVDFPHEGGLSEYGAEFKKVARIYPHHFASEGFFIARIKKG